MTNFLVIGGAILVLVLALYILPWLLSIVGAISALIWWLVVIPVVGTVLGLFFSYVIKRVILSKGSPYRDSPVITLGAVVMGWLIVLISSFG
ncbi:MAG: hypothetical protein CMO44_04825 [Verrucomicrobiales bacterium]|nr:hypothetical protein [Verrucomicrobiales bacterium]|tara:strand:+ start:226 stop:501 length:276 start_codon:yes stop_codon:yes gene_type:complete